MNDISVQFLLQIMTLFNWSNLNPNHNDTFQIGYYDQATERSVYPTGCFINLNTFNKP